MRGENIFGVKIVNAGTCDEDVAVKIMNAGTCDEKVDNRDGLVNHRETEAQRGKAGDVYARLLDFG